MSPRSRIEAECGRRGTEQVARACADLLQGRSDEPDLIVLLSGFVDYERYPDHWTRVWAARGLLWAWDDVALAALVGALADPEWRVREMAAKVVARHAVDGAFDAVQPLLDDPHARVRTQAQRAMAALTSSG